jgi:hypothetical protein
MTLLEVSLACFLLTLLMGATFAIFRAGSLAWSRSQATLDLYQRMRAAAARWNQEFAESTPSSLSVQNTTLAFASARQVSFQTNTPSDRPMWQKFVLYYLDGPQFVLRRREIPLPSPTTHLSPLPETDVGSGVQPLTYYFSNTQSRVVLGNVTRSQFDSDGRLVTLQLETQLAVRGGVQKLAFQISSRCSN